MRKEDVERFLNGHGFKLVASTIGDRYVLELENGWQITAFASKEGNIFLGTTNKDEYTEISIHLGDSIGTDYVFKSQRSLEANFDSTRRQLEDVSRNPDRLKCPKCKTRYVSPKRPREGQRWKPFLSCTGMIIERKGRSKGPICDGVSKALPAVVTFD